MGDVPFLFATPWPWWLVLLAAGGASVLTWRGYRRRTAELKAPLLRVLKALRLIGWVALFLCLLQPIYRETRPETYASRMTLLIDDSESMSFPDGANKTPRLERVREAFGDRDSASSLLGKLDRSFQIKFEAFAGGARPIDKLADLTGQGERTDLARSLNGALARLKGPDAGGLVLISDGADTARGDWLREAQSYRRAGLPVYAVGIGSADLPDLSVTQVRCRRTVQKDTLVHVEVDVARTGIPAGSQTVKIVRNGKTVREQQLDLQTERATATFEFLPDEQGFLEYEASVEPYGGELVTSNNTLSFGLVASSRKLKVLYMEGSVYQHSYYGRMTWRDRWEHEFLKLALEEDRDVEVDVLLKDFKGDLPGEVKLTKTHYPKTKKELYQYDVIINSDIPISHFNDEQIKNTVDFVAKHGGGFCMIGGWDAFGEGGYAKSAFDRMLPVQMEKNDTHADGKDFRWVVAEKGWTHPIMQIDKDPRKNREVWDKLNKLGAGGGPSFHGYSKTTHHKGAADVLAAVNEDDDPGTTVGPMILVAVQPFGAGYSMAFTTDSTGGWGTEWEDSWGDDPYDPDRRNIYYKTFWKNAVRWLAQRRLERPNQLVQIETDRLVYGRGESPEVRVKVLTEDYEPTHEAKVELKISGPGGISSVTLFPRYEEPGVYERKLELSQVGRYEIEAVAALKGDDIGADKAVLQVRPATEELRRLSQDTETLKKIASESGGEYLPFERIAELPEILHKDTHIIQRHRDWDLWDNGWVFAAIIGLLCAEWFIRKRAGLP